MRLERLFHVVRLKLRSLFMRRHVEQELDEEVRYHLDQQIQQYLTKGMPANEARRLAMRNFGGIEQRKEECRDARRVRFVDDLIQDTGYGLRALGKSRGFTIVAVLSLALGIGANTAMFSMVNAVLLQTLPVSRPDELVLLRSFQRNGSVETFAYPDYRQLRDRSSTFSGLLAASSVQPVDAGVGTETEQAHAEVVSANYFSVIGVSAGLGRTFIDADEEMPVAVISDRFWKRSFSQDPAVIGRALTINDAVCTIIGVAPPEFAGESAGITPDIWVPMGMVRAVRPSNFDLRAVRYVDWLNVIGRLKPGVTLDQARTAMNIVVPQIQQELGIDPNRDYLHHVELEPGSRGLSFFRGRFRFPLLILFAVVAMVLLIACLNLAGMLLARAATRRREIATRLAIGATRFRLVRQLLTESLLLTFLGGALGLLFASWFTGFIVRLLSSQIPLALNFTMDMGIVSFIVAVSIGTAILFGLAPALYAVRPVIPGERHRFRRVLLIGQVSLSLLLVASAALFIGTLRNLKGLDAGFNPERVLQVRFDRRSYEYGGAALAALATRLTDRVAAIPRVVTVSYAVNGSLAYTGSGVTGLEADESVLTDIKDRRVSADWVGPAYFRTLEIPIMTGREFSNDDTATSPRVAIINQTMARQFFGEQRAVGRRLRFNKQELEIIGVARDAKYRELRESTPPMLYFALLQNPASFNVMEIRTDGSPLNVAAAVREAIREVDPRLRLGGITTLADRMDQKLISERLVADISGFFSSMTLFLVAIGIYGMLAHTVAERTNEIGIRTALGAQRKSVLWMVLRDALVTLGAGVCLGIPAVFAFGQLISSMLFGLAPWDPGIIALAALVVCAAGLAAAYIPARRASRIDPVAALRHE